MSLRLPNLFALAMLALLLSLLAFCATNYRELQGISMEVNNPAVIPIDSHSTNHVESGDIIGCNNILSVWLDPKCEKLNIIKQLDDGTYCNEVILPSKRGLLLKTAYSLLGAASEKDVSDIMKAKGCSKVSP